MLQTTATISQMLNLVILHNLHPFRTLTQIITSVEKTVNGHDVLTKHSSAIKLTSSHISRNIFTVINGVDVLMAYSVH